jgi:hypothetical protein
VGRLHRRGADDYQYVAKLAKAGFDGIDIEPTRVYNIEDARTFLTGQGVDVDAIAPQVEGKFMSAFIRATKARELLRSRLLRVTWARRMTAEAVGTGLLLAAVVGSGIMGERLAGETSRSRCLPTRSQPAQCWSRSFSLSGRSRERISIRP